MSPFSFRYEHRIAQSLLALWLLALCNTVFAGDGMTIGQRVACQAALEDIAWNETLWPEANRTPKPARRAVLPDAAIRARVEDQLRMEAALADDYGIRIDKAMLQAELDRMARQSRAPERLKQRFAALDNDANHIAECLVRPYLVGLELRRAYARDDREQGDEALARRDFEDWWAMQRGRWASLPAASGTTGLQLPTIRSGVAGDLAKAVAADSWRTGNTPSPRNRHSAVWTGSEMIVWGGVNASNTSLNTGGRYNPASDTWIPMANIGAPSTRGGHTAVWTGTEMIVFGGSVSSGGNRGNGGRYNPASDTWVASSSVNALGARSRHTAVWTGSEMIVWGGFNGGRLGNGSRYDPVADTWTATSATDAPGVRHSHTAVWTGSEMVVWGGFGDFPGDQNTGGRYDPVADTWTATNTTGAPDARAGHTAVWSGSVMIVWGGQASATDLNTGGRYNPATDTWQATRSDTAPSPRWKHRAVWTGSAMIVWGGGINGVTYNTGSRYNPGSNTWSATTTSGAPAAREYHSAVWTGDEMIVWGGSVFSGNVFDSGGRYSPGGNDWESTASNSTPHADAPDARLGHTALWTGSEMIVWGGQTQPVGGSYLGSGARYRPASDTWIPTASGGAPSARALHTAVWNGSEMIVWGGTDTGYVGDGARYDPFVDQWTATPATNAPSARAGHAAVWTGSDMIVWGGYDGASVATGGRYDVAGNSWSATATTGAPAARFGHTAVWTGDRMIVWGGVGVAELASGSRYDPVDDAWSATTGLGAPSARGLHTAVWTGSEMIVWGGSAAGNGLGTGSRYDPAGDVWTATTSTGAPSARTLHSAVWTGDEMIVWGGNDLGNGVSSGARYSPADDTWSSTTNTGAPSARFQQTAVWTGNSMIVWGGFDSAAIGTMGTYYPGAVQASGSVVQPLAPSPSVLGSPLTVTVRVTGETAAPASGAIVVSASTGETCSDDTPVAFDTVSADFSCDLLLVGPGARTVGARFSGSASHFESNAAAVPHTALSASSVVITAVAPTPSDVGQSVTITFEVSGSAPTGTVGIDSDLDGAVSGCTAMAVDAGSCTVAAGDLSVGTHALTASYSGDADNLPGISAGVVHVVTLIAQDIDDFIANPASPAFLAGGTFTVSASGGASGNPVTFSIAPASSGVCSIAAATIIMLAPGTCTILADQAGDASHAPAAQASLAIVLQAVSIITSIDDARTSASRGEMLDYVVMLLNGGPNVANDVAVDVTLAPQLDASQAVWFCNDADAGLCSAGGTGTLADSNVSIPVGDTVSYVLSVPIRADATGVLIETTLNVTSPDQNVDAISDNTVLLTVFQDGFED